MFSSGILLSFSSSSEFNLLISLRHRDRHNLSNPIFLELHSFLSIMSSIPTRTSFSSMSSFIYFFIIVLILI
jgi:hypothetical protein